MKKIDILLFLFIGAMVGAITTHLLWHDHFHSEMKERLEQSIIYLSTDR